MPEPTEIEPYATPAEVAAWLDQPTSDDGPALVLITATANFTVAQLLGTLSRPAEITRHAVCVLAADLWEQRNAPFGVRVFADGLGGSAPMRVRDDAAGRARAILRLAPVVL